MHTDNPMRLLIIGGGPAGHAAASASATLGTAVTIIEDTVIGGAAHLLDCIPSKAMAASSMRISAIRNAGRLGINDVGKVELDMAVLAKHLRSISATIEKSMVDLLESQGVDMIRGRGRLTGAHTAIAETDQGEIEIEFDKVLLSTGSRPWVPGWADLDERVFTTRGVYSLPEQPEHIVVVGSGVTGVEMVHIFSSLGSKVTLVVSRHQVLPYRDAEVAAVLEEAFLERGVSLLKGSRASRIDRTADGVVVHTEDGRRVEATHCLLAVGAVPNSKNLGLEKAGVDTDRGYISVDEHNVTNVSHIYAAGDVCGELPLSSVATMQGRKIARHAVDYAVVPLDYGKVAQAIFTEPEIASVGLEEVHAASEGRKVRITKVPLAANARALIQGNPHGFVKVISDPATRIVLGGTVVGHHASELIAPIALAVTAHLRVDVLLETLMVHPSLVESIAEAAE